MIICPFKVAIDTREQAPFHFGGMRADASKHYKPLAIETQVCTLRTGDYSIVGLEHEITIERKSISDAFSTFTVHRDRFERELERMQAMRFAAVIIEADWSQLLAGPARSEHPERIAKSVYRSILAWQVRYRAAWFLMPSRLHAEKTTFRLLERYWEDRSEKQKLGSVPGEVELVAGNGRLQHAH